MAWMTQPIRGGPIHGAAGDCQSLRCGRGELSQTGRLIESLNWLRCAGRPSCLRGPSWSCPPAADGLSERAGKALERHGPCAESDAAANAQACCVKQGAQWPRETQSQHRPALTTPAPSPTPTQRAPSQRPLLAAPQTPHPVVVSRLAVSPSRRRAPSCPRPACACACARACAFRPRPLKAPPPLPLPQHPLPASSAQLPRSRRLAGTARAALAFLAPRARSS